MHRNKILKLLNEYKPIDLEDKQQQEEIISFVNKNEKCFERELEIGHITGSAWIIDNNYNSILLNNHKKLNTWMQFGGHADGENDILEVTKKEVFEETGLKFISLIYDGIFNLDVHEIPQFKDIAPHKHYDIQFLFSTDISAKIEINFEESNEIKWVKIEDVNQYTTDPAAQKMLRKVKLIKEYEQTISSKL